MPKPWPSRRVVIVQKSLPHYRGPFFERLRLQLAHDGIELRLLYGQAIGADASRRDTIDLSWAEPFVNRVVKVGKRQLLWQPVLRYVEPGDLVIVEQATKLLVNNVLFAQHAAGMIRMAYWGHGQNLDLGNRSRPGERVKALTSRHVHWWFVYTNSGAAVVAQLGFPADCITVVQNAIDTTLLRRAQKNIHQSELQQIKDTLGIRGSNIAIFCGGLYPEKRLDILVQAADIIRRQVPDFELIVVGAGPASDFIAAAALTRTWIHPLGPVLGPAVAPFFSLAKLLLIPGWTGLSIVDSFVFETALVTIQGSQPPEIEYLEDGVNGRALPCSTTPIEYAAEVSRLLLDEAARTHLSAGCRAAASIYTIERMVENFALGVREALSIR